MGGPVVCCATAPKTVGVSARGLKPRTQPRCVIRVVFVAPSGRMERFFNSRESEHNVNANRKKRSSGTRIARTARQDRRILFFTDLRRSHRRRHHETPRRASQRRQLVFRRQKHAVLDCRGRRDSAKKAGTVPCRSHRRRFRRQRSRRPAKAIKHFRDDNKNARNQGCLHRRTNSSTQSRSTRSPRCRRKTN